MAARIAAAVALCCIFVGAAGASPRSDKERAKTLYKEGLRLYAKGDYLAARSQFDQALQLVDDPAFLFNLGQCARALSDHGGALEMYRRFLARMPDAPNRAKVEGYIAEEERLASGAVAPPPKPTTSLRDDCPQGKTATEESEGHCCWPGQVWERGRNVCAGRPNCPAGFEVSGSICVAARGGGATQCPPGQSVSVDTSGHCCWPGQVWANSRGACIGPPSCPAGFDAVAGDSCREKPKGCAEGQLVSEDTAGNCCWPGQAWSKGRSVCVGVPQCPGGFEAKGEGCAKPSCPAGQAISEDTAGHCCWPGQAWSQGRSACVGIPQCPAGLAADPATQACVAGGAAPVAAQTVPVAPTATPPQPATVAAAPGGTVSVAFTSRSDANYTVTVGDKSCTTPCELPLAPGKVQLRVAGAGEFSKEINVMDGPTTVSLNHLHTGKIVAGAVLTPIGLAMLGWGLYMIPFRLTDLGLILGIVSTAAGVVVSAIGISSLAGMGSDKAEVSGRPRAKAPRLRLIGMGAGVVNGGAAAGVTFGF